MADSTVDYQVVAPSLEFVVGFNNVDYIVTQPTVEFTVINGEFCSFDLVVQSATLDYLVAQGTQVTFDLTVRRPITVTTVLAEERSSLQAVIRPPVVAFSAYEDGVVSLNSSVRNISFVFASSNQQASAGTDKTYVFNPFNLATSTYSNYSFNSYFSIGRNYYGINSTGIHLLSGDTDGTAQIQSEVITPLSSFDKQGMKSCSDAVVFGRLDGDMEIIPVVDEQKEYLGHYAKSDERTGLHRIRVKIPTGIQGATWQFKIKNVNGAGFAINNLEVILRELQRMR